MDAGGPPCRVGESGGQLVERVLFAPEERLAGRAAAGMGGFVESIGAVHQHDDLAIVIDDAGSAVCTVPILARGPQEI